MTTGEKNPGAVPEEFLVGGVRLPRPFRVRRIDNENWPESVRAASDTFIGEIYLGPMG